MPKVLRRKSDGVTFGYNERKAMDPRFEVVEVQPGPGGAGGNTGVPILTEPTAPLWDGMWAGRRAFVVLGGPSLDGFDWSRLDGELVIAVNRAAEHCKPQIRFSMDGRYLDGLQSGQWPDVGPDVLQVWTNSGPHVTRLPAGVTILDLVNGNHSWSWSLKDGIGWGLNSGYGAINLAAILGANPIYVLGLDMKPGPRANFHEGYGLENKPEDEWGREIAAMKDAAQFCHGRQIRVYNLNPDSAVECFAKKAWEEVPAKPEKPVFATFCTPGYRLSAREWQRSVQRYGLETCIVEMEDAGSWRANTWMKPLAVKKARELHPGRAIVFLDADSRMVRYPEIFDGCALGDVAFYFLRDELLSGTMYWGATQKADALLESWIKTVSSLYEHHCGEQMTLQKAFEAQRKNIEFSYIPDSYCRIFDNIRQRVEPVILQFQASRDHT